MALHRYDVHIVEPLDLAVPIEPGAPTPELRDLWTSVEATSPEAAVEIARPRWREKYGEDVPSDAEAKVTPRADVCSRCRGRGWVVPPGVIDPGDDAPLGSARKRTCPECLGSGKRR
jgi:hypothetical protein